MIMRASGSDFLREVKVAYLAVNFFTRPSFRDGYFLPISWPFYLVNSIKSDEGLVFFMTD